MGRKQKQKHIQAKLYKFNKDLTLIMKSFSKTFSIPMMEKQFQTPQLFQTMQEIMQKQQEIMQQKLLREEQIQNRLKRLQKHYEDITQQKQVKIKYKMQKSEKNRHLFLEKIVKRCKDKDRNYNEKMKFVTSKRKQSLRQAWKAATKFNEKILEGKNVRQNSFDHKAQAQKSKDQENLNQSLLIPDNIDEENKSLLTVNIPVSGQKNNSKVLQSAFANRSLLKSFDHMAFQSTFNIEKKYSVLPKAINTQSQRIIKTEKVHTLEEENPENSYQQKLRKTLVRHKQNMMEEENKKIQDYGQRLQKITLSRRKRDELHKSRSKRHSMQNDAMYDQMDRGQSKPVKKQNKRMKSESQSIYDRHKRVTDFSQSNKERRQNHLLTHIQEGNQYLSQNKIRHLKEMMSKNLAYNALQKKLFIQRFRHV